MAQILKSFVSICIRSPPFLITSVPRMAVNAFTVPFPPDVEGRLTLGKTSSPKIQHALFLE